MSLNVYEDYLQATQHSYQGKIYYESGELLYEGGCVKLMSRHICPCGIGIQYYKDGTIKKQGLFQRRGLVCGRLYYPSGKLHFEGYFCSDREVGYGPVYPTNGIFYNEDGSINYEGDFEIKKSSLGYPTVVIPENFGTLT